jgi:hypothetical protein
MYFMRHLITQSGSKDDVIGAETLDGEWAPSSNSQNDRSTWIQRLSARGSSGWAQQRRNWNGVQTSGSTAEEPLSALVM